jgi:molybdopterin-guanine dinucleotide biosynthesis protein A
MAMDTERRPGTAGLILCGGHSSRMGRDKAALRFGAETLLERVLARMRAVAEPVAVSLAAEEAARPRPALPPEVLAVPDRSADEGPLAGLAEGFRRLSGLAERVLVMPVDMPFLTEPWLARLAEGLERERAVLYRYQGFTNALTAGYRLELSSKLERLLAQGRRRPMALAEGESPLILIVEELWPADSGPPPLMDVDTAEDYRDALRWEGIGNARGVPVTVRWGAGTPADPAPPPLPLWATTAEEALALAARVYPEWARALERVRREGHALAGAPGAERAVGWEQALAPGARVLLELG